MPRPPPGFEWDEAKANWNRRVHQVSFAAVVDFEFVNALRLKEQQHDQEVRYVEIGKIRRTLHVVVYARRGEKIRVVSLRKAEREERRLYLEKQGY